MPFRDRYEKDDDWDFLADPTIDPFKKIGGVILYFAGIAVIVLILRMFIF
jgi:hypothetical protein